MWSNKIGRFGTHFCHLFDSFSLTMDVNCTDLLALNCIASAVSITLDTIRCLSSVSLAHWLCHWRNRVACSFLKIKTTISLSRSKTWNFDLFSYRFEVVNVSLAFDSVCFGGLSLPSNRLRRPWPIDDEFPLDHFVSVILRRINDTEISDFRWKSFWFFSFGFYRKRIIRLIR